MSGNQISKALAISAAAALLATALAVPAGAATSTPTVSEAAKRFAPILAFDYSQQGYPMSAQVFFKRMLRQQRDEAKSLVTWAGHQPDRSLDPPKGYTYSKVRSSLTSTGGPDYNWYWTVQTAPGEKNLLNGGIRPTYYAVAPHPNGALRIMYWWFYAYQYPCNTSSIGDSGAHFGDWERVMVTTTRDRQQVESVTYWQHGGSYTRTPGKLVAGRPVVYVGKDSHGSYHFKYDNVLNHDCRYWNDVREPRGSIPTSPPAKGANIDYWWTSTSPLVFLPRNRSKSSESWMLADRVGKRWRDSGLVIQLWRWGPRISYYCSEWDGMCGAWPRWTKKNAVGTHPTSVKNQPSWNMKSCGSEKSRDGCSKDQASKWIVGMGTLKATKFVWAKRIGVKFVIDRVTSLGPSADNDVRLKATLPRGFGWVVDSKAACKIKDGTKLFCNLGQMPIEDNGITVRVHAKKPSGPFRAVVTAKAIWPDLNQYARARLVFEKR